MSANLDAASPTLASKPGGSTYGILFLSLVISAIFYGVTLLQTWIYYRRYLKDPISTKLLVAGLWFLDTMHLIFCTISVYWYLVTNYGNSEALDISYWSMNTQTDFSGLVGMLVQFFFARRVFLLSNNVYLVGIICLLACLHFCLGIVFTVGAFALGHFSKYSKLTWVSCVGFGAAAAADIMIATAMCYYLSKRRTEFKRTNNIITTLMIYSINTGLLTSIVATACVVSFAISPTSFVWLSFFWVLGKCYVNSLMGMLNSRDQVRGKGRHAQDLTFVELQTTHPTDSEQDRMKRAGFNPTMNLEVAVQTVTETKADYVSSPVSRDETATP